jgi:hypothetical protein
VIATGLSGIAGSAEVHADPTASTSRSSSRDKRFAAPKPPTYTWVETGNDDGIVTYKRDVPGSDIIALRGQGVIAAPITRVASVVLDHRRATEWVDSLEEFRVVRMLGSTEFVEYNRIGTPPLLADRDFVCHGKVEVDLAAQTLTLSLTPTVDPAVPVKEDYVRGRLSGYWKLRSIDGGRKTFVVAEMHGDPKGAIPKWLVNAFQSGWARNTLESLRKQVEKPDIQIVPEVKAVFEGKPMPQPAH